MSNAFSLAPVVEPPASPAADRVGAILAGNPTWVRPFILLLASTDFQRPPGLTHAGEVFERTTDGEGSRLLEALTDLYGEIRDGLAMTKAQGDMLERFVWHVLLRRFPDRLGSCRLLEDGEATTPDFKFDAATRDLPPSCGVEAKSSERAIVPHPSRRSVMTSKCRWLVDMRDRTDGRVAGVFASWSPDETFRRTLRDVIGDAEQRALVIAHEALRNLPARLEAIERDLEANPLEVD